MVKTIIFGTLFIVFSTTYLGAQCDLVFRYDEAGNRIFRGNPCDPDCSTHVTNTSDTGKGSLRKAIFCAENGDVVTFNSLLAGNTVGLTSGAIEVDKNIEISTFASPPVMGNPPPETVRVQTFTDDIIFNIPLGSTVIIRGLNMTSNAGFNGDPSIILNNGDLTLRDLDLIDDASFQNQGSTILNQGILDILETVKLFYVFYN